MRQHLAATTLVLLVCLGVAARPALAQFPGPGSDSMAARVMATAQRMRDPAQFVLDHAKELELSASQIAALTELKPALADSGRVRMQRAMAGMMANPGGGAGLGQAMQRWDGPLDEAALRASLQPQLDMQASLMIDMIRDRLQVGAVLTPAQRALLPKIEMSERMAQYRQP